MIRATREIQARKISKRTKILYENGDVMVDNVLVPKRLWSNLVPILCERLRTLFIGVFKEETIDLLMNDGTKVVASLRTSAVPSNVRVRLYPTEMRIGLSLCPMGFN